MAAVPRPSRFSDDDVLDAALAGVVAHGREVTVAQIAAELGGPVGSIYHRFGSREELLARLWVRCIHRFHAALLPVMDAGDAHASLVAAARFVVVYCDQHRDEALGLRLFSQERLLAIPGLPDGLRTLIAEVNDDLEARTVELTRGLYGRATQGALRRVHLASRITPYGMVRPWLGQAVPRQVADAAAASADAILRLGDPSAGASR